MSYETELRDKNRGCMKLFVRQRAMDLFALAWKIAFIENRIDFKLHSQFVDAAQSVSADIAEGYGSRSINEYIQFVYYALGSLGEALTRAIGLRQTEQIKNERCFKEFNEVHYEVENRLL